MLLNSKKTPDTYSIAVLHKSFYPPTSQCGHWARLSEMVDQMHRQGFSLECPHCGDSVSYIKDSGVANKNQEDETVTFKFGKVVYCLSIPGGANTSPIGWMERLFQRLRVCQPRVTAQARIAEALQLDRKSMKILSKGKIVFASSQQKDNFQDFTISQSLTDRASQDNNDLAARNPTPRLLVVGTPRGVLSPKAPPMMERILNASLYDILECTIRTFFQIGARLIRFLFFGKSWNSQE
jgi:hypothetical protein